MCGVGTLKKVFTLKVNLSYKIADVKAMAHGMEPTPPDYNCLIYVGKRLEDGRPVADYGIKNESTLHLCKGAKDNL